jgi:hypothetical protein
VHSKFCDGHRGLGLFSILHTLEGIISQVSPIHSFHYFYTLLALGSSDKAGSTCHMYIQHQHCHPELYSGLFLYLDTPSFIKETRQNASSAFSVRVYSMIGMDECLLLNAFQPNCLPVLFI